MRQVTLGWLWSLLLALAPLQGGAATYVMTTITANWIDASAHTKITANSSPYRFVGGGSTGCGSTPPTLDDVISEEIPIGFSFMFGGVNFSSLRVMTNGRLQFGNTTCGYGTQAVGPPQTFPYGYPNTSMNYTMRIYGGDLDATVKRSASTDPGDSVNNYPTTCTSRDSCYISYALIGTAPNRSFVVTWNNVPEWVNSSQTAGNFNLQIILQENGEFIYQFGVTNYASTGRAQVGWQLDSQDYEVSQVGLPASGTAFKYYIPRPLAEYRMEQPAWTGSAGEILDTSGYGRHAARVGTPTTVANAPGYICRGASIPSNANTNNIDAIATPLSASTDIGSSGTITFWYKPETWQGASAKEVMLFDATTANNEHFYLAKTLNGNGASATARLRFAIRDSGGTTRVVTATSPALNANGSVHIGVIWSFNPLEASNSDFLRIYVNGVLAAQSAFTTAASISASLGTLHVGDNRSDFSPYGRAAEGVIDEFRIYNYAAALGLILRDMNQANACLAHYAIQHAGAGFTCAATQVTVQAHTGEHGLVVMPNNTTMVQLSTSTGLGDWALVSGYGTINNGAAGDGVATYIFNGEYQAVFALTHTAAGTVNINVTDGQISEVAGEDPNLVLSSCTVAAFNACEKTAPQCVPQQPPANKYDHLFTKLAATAFDLDLVALKEDGSLDGGFNGQVTVNLLANLSSVAVNPSTQCPTAASTATVPLGTLSFSGGRTTKSVGSSAFSSVAPNYSAYKDVRVRFSCTEAQCGRVIDVCSTDSFSVRPTGFSVSATTTGGAALNNASPSSGSPSLMAGKDFLISAAAVAGYNGAPTIKRTVADQTVASHLGATDYVGNLRDASGSNTLSLSAATVSSGLSTGTVQYHDYGQFRLKAGAVRDSAFAAADASNGDCVAGSMSDTPVNGKYGCDIANQADTGLFGRFFPSHFAVSGTLTPGCAAGSMTYAGQPFVLTYSVTAMSFPNPQLADAATMTRYSAGTVSVGLFDGASATDLAGSLTPSPGVGAWLNGIFMPSATDIVYTRAATPSAPLDTAYVAIRVTDADGATIKKATAAQTTVNDADFKAGTPACTSACTHKKVSGVPTAFRYGRLWLGNAYGSEKNALQLPYQAQYWNGFAFIPNGLDTCTVLTPANFGLGNYQNGVNATNLPVGALSVSAISAGEGHVTLAAPNAGGSVDVVTRLDTALAMCPTAWTPAYPPGTPATANWLRGKWCGTGYDKDPVVRATFGVTPSRQIYLREGYR